jgi:hypothetical protein
VGSKDSREHSADEFGRVGSACIRGVEAPTIAAPTLIMIDGIVERESGATPPPPAISVKAIAIVLGIMLVSGVALLIWVEPYVRANAGR